MMSDRQIKRAHHKVYRNGVDSEKVRLISGHVGYLKKVRKEHFVLKSEVSVRASL